MELPKNITQIGEANHRCKIYVEDYVISYMKQLNQVAQDKDMAVALYGVRKEENEVSYLFLYGACKLNFLQKETRHMSQAQQQEVEKFRTKYFPDYTFLGYRLLNGEMIEGFHICEQGICRYISGYAQFYEKNDSMLAYMLDVREEAQPEEVNQEKYEVVKKKQEERRIQHEDSKSPQVAPQTGSNSLRGMRFAVVAVFALLCMVGISSLNGEGKLDDLQAKARQVMGTAMEQQIPDAVNEAEEAVQVDTLIAEDKLAEAILQENEVAPIETIPQSEPIETTSVPESLETPSESQAASVIETPSESQAASVPETPSESQAASVPETPSESQAASVPETPNESQTASVSETPSESQTTNIPESEEVTAVVEAKEAEAQPVSYIIKEGDTLIGISVENYGSDVKVTDICSLNQIDNPDDIKVGQKILLP